MCHASRGDRGSFVHTSEEISRIRSEEAGRAAEICGAEATTLGQSDGDVNAADPEQRRLMIDLVRETQPELIITHHPGDYMGDHNETSKLVFDCSFHATLPLLETTKPNYRNVTPIYYMDTLMGLGFQPTEYVDVSAVIDTKTVMLEAHQSQLTWLRDHVKDAKGILIVPQLLKAAFFFGGSGGSGVFLARDEKTGEWSDPAFYTLGSGSFGLQFGAEASEVVLLAMTQRGVKAMLDSNFKLGVGASIAAGPIGGGVEGATANLSADILSFARSKGAFVGVSLEGAVVATRDELSSAYYGKEVQAMDILVKRDVHNSHAAALRAAVGKAARGSATPDK